MFSHERMSRMLLSTPRLGGVVLGCGDKMACSRSACKWDAGHRQGILAAPAQLRHCLAAWWGDPITCCPSSGCLQMHRGRRCCPGLSASAQTLTKEALTPTPLRLTLPGLRQHPRNFHHLSYQRHWLCPSLTRSRYRRSIDYIMADHGVPAAAIDQTPISPSRPNPGRKNSLEYHLSHRPERQELVDST